MNAHDATIRDRDWTGWFQGAGLVVGGLLSMIGAALPWQHAVSSIEGLEFGAGQLSFALGLAAVALGLFAASTTNWRLHFLISIVGIWLSTAVLVLTVEQLGEIRQSASALGFIAITVGNGIYVTLAGGALIALDSVVGVLPGLRRLAILTQ